MSGLAQARSVLFVQCGAYPRDLIRHTCSERLANLFQDIGVATACGQNRVGVKQVQGLIRRRRMGCDNSINNLPQRIRLHRLGQKIVHAGGEASFAIGLAGARCECDDRQVLSAAAFMRANRSRHREAVHLRHMDVQQQQVECAPRGQRDRISTITGDVGAVTPLAEKLLQQNHIEFVVLSHQDVQRLRRARGIFRVPALMPPPLPARAPGDVRPIT